MAIRKVGKYFQIDYYDPNGKRIRKNFKKKKDAVAEEAKRKALVAEGRYLDVKKEYDTTLGEAIALYEKNFSRQPSFNSAKIFFIERYKEYFGIDQRLTDIRYQDLETYRRLFKTATHPKGDPQNRCRNQPRNVLFAAYVQEGRRVGTDRRKSVFKRWIAFH